LTDVLSVENMRKSDAHTIEAGTSGRDLMMRAAKGIYENAGFKAPVAIVCGSGNNAGDGYALAVLLKRDGVSCSVFVLKDKFSDDGRYYYDLCLQEGVDVRFWSDDTDLSGYVSVVDCILGTGFKGSVGDDIKAVIERINESGAYIVAADINSGLNGDTGMTECAVISDLTVSIGGFKPGHFLNMAKDHIKEKVNVDIGIKPVDSPYHLVEAGDIKDVFAERNNYSNKGTYGYTALIGGSEMYSGAIRLAYMANAAMRAGAGVVKVAVPESIRTEVSSHILESTLFPMPCNDGAMMFDGHKLETLISNVRSVAFGMGIGTGEDTRSILEYLINHYQKTLIIDADGLTELATLGRDIFKHSSAKIVLTPHIKEFSRLTGLSIDEILADPIETVRRYAGETGCVLLLKGPSTVVTDGDEVFITDRGCAGMATAGSGDVLSGILSAVTAYEPDLLRAVCAAAYINGRAGELAQSMHGSISMIASDTVSMLEAAIGEIVNS